jgi:hypothetical protein
MFSSRVSLICRTVTGCAAVAALALGVSVADAGVIYLPTDGYTVSVVPAVVPGGPLYGYASTPVVGYTPVAPAPYPYGYGLVPTAHYPLYVPATPVYPSCSHRFYPVRWGYGW